MLDRWVVIVVSLLTLTAMCALLYAATVWIPDRVEALEESLDRIEAQKAAIDVMYNELKHLDEIREKLAEAARTGTDTAALARIDAGIDDLSTKMKKTLTEVNRIGGLPQKDDLKKVSGEISALSAKVAGASKSDPELRKLAGELGKLKTDVKAAQSVLGKKVDALKGELKSINLMIQKLDAQIKRIPTNGS